MVAHKQVYSKTHNPNATFHVEDQLVVDLFPYKIKDRNRFYHRDHPENLHPKSLAYKKYWMDFAKPCIEGEWIEDKDGTWVYMMPKLFYYINYVVILDEDRRKIQPHLCDLEWIFFTYFLCLDGFSGFEGDDKYTCNRMVERYHKSKDTNLSEGERKKFELNVVELERLPDNCYSEETGEIKEFVDPWTYLTRTYLIDEPRGPLGDALYDNQRRHGFILGARGIRKSFTVYMGDFMHEWHFSGVKKFEDFQYAKSPLLFAMGSGSKDQMQRTLNNVIGFYDSQPGRYRSVDSNGNEQVNGGPFYKNTQGTLTVGKNFQHILKDKNHRIKSFGSTCQISVITPDRDKIVAGDRFRRVYIEEVGFIEYIESVYNANVDSLKLGKKHVGSWIATGTGGDMVAIKGSKKLFENPASYDIFGIPYYWKNPDKKIGLFIPAHYQRRDLEDENGFVYLELAAEGVIKDRNQWFSELDSVTASSRVMYNPINPDEMLIPNELSVLPKKEAQIRLTEIESRDLDKRFSNIGTLKYDNSYPHGVRFDKDLSRKLNPIEDYHVDFAKTNRDGAFIMYEAPPGGKIPKNMYWVVYDPAAKSGDGTSLHSVIVYKHFLAVDGKTWRDTIVAEWIGRKGTLNLNYEMVIKIAKFFNARVFPEINVAGFIEWCKSNNHLNMLQRDSYELQKELSPGSKRSYYKAGFRMTDRMKWWALQRLSDWLMEVRDSDPETGIPITRNIDYVYSKRLLNEIIYYNKSDNFDHISSALGLMILIGQLDNYIPPNEDEEDDDSWHLPQPGRERKVLTRRRSKLENFLI